MKWLGLFKERGLYYGVNCKSTPNFNRIDEYDEPIVLLFLTEPIDMSEIKTKLL